MTTNSLGFRQMLVVCAVALIAVASVTAFGVIPAVQADTTPGARPEAVVPVLWVMAALHLLFTCALALLAFRSRGRSWVSTSALVALGTFLLLFGFALADGAAAYRSEGASMLPASRWMYVCAAADYLCGALTIVAPSLRPRTA